MEVGTFFQLQEEGEGGRGSLGVTFFPPKNFKGMLFRYSEGRQ